MRRCAQVVVEAVEMQSGVATTVPLQAPTAFPCGAVGGSIVAATTVAATVASVAPQMEKVAAETRVQV